MGRKKIMNMTKSNNFFNEINLTHAIILSLIIHVIFVMKLQISNLNLNPKPITDIIFNTEIVKQEAPKIIPQSKPKPIIKPKPIKRPKPIQKPIPIPEPIVEPIPEPIVEPITDTVETNTTPQTIPEIRDQVPSSPNPQVVNNYSNQLRTHIAKHKKYPRIAQRRKMQGEVVVEIQIGGDGSLVSKRIEKSSGYKVLDKEGMNMMEKSKPFPVPPDTLRGSVTTVVVPIAFNLI